MLSSDILLMELEKMKQQITQKPEDFDSVVAKISSLEEVLINWQKEQAKEATARENRWKANIFKFGGILIGASGALWTLLEMGSWYYEKMQIQNMADRYSLVALEMYDKENNPDVALSFINKAIELDDGNFEYRFVSAYINGIRNVRLLLNLDRPFSQVELNAAHQTLADAKFLRELQPNRSEPYILESQIYTALREYKHAEESIQHAIKLNPNDSYAKVRYATLLYNQRKRKKALQIITEAVQLDTKSKWALLWYGIILNSNKETDKAITALTKAIELDPKFDAAIYNLACCYLNLRPRNFDKARELFQQTLRINPANKEALYQLGMSYGYQDKYDIALVYMNKAIALDEDFLTARKWKAVILFELKRYQEAAEEYSKAIMLDPRNGSLYVRCAEAELECKQYTEAINHLNFALELNCSDVSAATTLVKVYLATQNLDLALKRINETLAVVSHKPSMAELYILRAKLHKANGNLKSAIADQSLAVQSYKSKHTLLGRARYLQDAGHKDAALQDLAEINKLDPKFAPAWKYAVMLLKDCDPKSALEKLDFYLELQPQDKSMAVLKKELQAKIALANKKGK